MPLIRFLFIAVPLLKKALRNPKVRQRLGLKPLTRQQVRQQRRQARKSGSR